MDKLQLLGRGPGFILLAHVIVVGLYILSWCDKDVAALTGPLGILVTGVFGAGAAKYGMGKFAEAKKNGNTG